jgi:hypothetical protein
MDDHGASQWFAQADYIHQNAAGYLRHLLNEDIEANIDKAALIFTSLSALFVWQFYFLGLVSSNCFLISIRPELHLS